MEKQKSFTLIEHERPKGGGRNESFTLIELLVVVAIIGLISSIVFVAVGNVRDEAKDSAIKKDFHQLRNVAEMIYTREGNYGAVCDEADNSLANTGEIGLLEEAIKKYNRGQKVTCFESSDKQSFAVSSPLVARKGKHWCVESAGLSRELDHSITSAKCE